jgi:hypothetical protein
MTYYIFLKSVRSLEEFRKNPHVKIPHNLLLQISKALVNSKIQFLIQKFFFLISARLTLRPTRPLSPASPLAASSLTAESARPAHPARASVASSREICFLFQITPSRAGRFLPLSPPRGPRLSVLSSPPRRPTPVGIFPRAAAPRLGCPRAFTVLPHHFPSLIPFKPSVNGP